MFNLDHVAISVTNLEKSIEFYEKLGFKLENIFNDNEYRWATLSLNQISLEIFCYINNNQKYSSNLSTTGVNHFALNTDDIETTINFIKNIYQKEIDIYYGDLNRQSFWIEDPDKIKIQIIKSKQRK